MSCKWGLFVDFRDLSFLPQLEHVRVGGEGERESWYPPPPQCAPLSTAICRFEQPGT